MTFEKASLHLRLLGILLEGLHGLHRTADIALDQDKGVSAGEQGIKVGPGAVASDGPTHQGIFGDLANALTSLQTGPQVGHLLDGEALVIKDQGHFGPSEKIFELLDDLLLALQCAAHRKVERNEGNKQATQP